MRLIAVLALTLLVSACAAGPRLRTSVADGEGPLLPGCQNLSQSARPDRFVTSSYLSTYGSAWVEGATQGMAEGLQESGAARRLVDPFAAFGQSDPPPGVRAMTAPTPPQPFCRVVGLPPGQVVQGIARTMASVGRPIRGSSATQPATPRASGDPRLAALSVDAARSAGASFWTDHHQASHRAAEWFDKYVFHVRPGLGPDTSEIRILRHLHISRDGRIYNQAFSSGQNEAWILAQLEMPAARR